MMMKITMPTYDQSMRGGRVLRWHKGEGDDIGFGDDICDVAIDEFAVLRRTGRATLLSGRRQKKLRDDLEVREGKVYREMTITSSDQGTLRKVVAGEGDSIALGDLLAVVTTDGQPLSGTPADWQNATPMRVVVNALNDEEDF
jgi:pyruvate/2-oxoglutarate dehydrogenase complex dihydrolipoamide acyltransferase (E2) component